MSQSPQSDYDHFRVLLFQNEMADLLLKPTDGGLRLPALTVRKHTRVAEELTTAIAKQWSLTAYCLFSLPSEADANPFTCYQVAELCPTEVKPPVGMLWFPTNSINAEQFAERADFAATEQSQKALNQYRRAELSGVFGKPGWLRDVTEWVAECAAASGFRLTGKFRQLNASPTFSLLRFATDGPALWFKAVGEPNTREYAITIEIAALLRGSVPNVIASKAEWNAWLSVDAEGCPLSDASCFSDWQRVVSTLADLQIASVGNSLHLIERGCRDLRVCSLRGLVDPFFKCMTALMEQADSNHVRLSGKELNALAGAIQDALDEFAGSNIPNVLGHLDCNPDNIIVGRDRCIFLDWAEGYVGPPFLTFQYLLEYAHRLSGPDLARNNGLISSYLDRWRRYASTSEIEATLDRAPLIAAFAFAAGGGIRHDGPTLRPEISALLRSVTRRMKKEADRLARGSQSPAGD